MDMPVTYKHEKKGPYPHIEWLELYADGILHECAIMNRDEHGNVLFFRTNDLDEVDRRRLAGILMNRNAANFRLWDLMAQQTLNNGMNALAYFHQLVRQLTPSGKVIDPRLGQMTGVTGTPNPPAPVEAKK